MRRACDERVGHAPALLCGASPSSQSTFVSAQHQGVVLRVRMLGIRGGWRGQLAQSTCLFVSAEGAVFVSSGGAAARCAAAVPAFDVAAASLRRERPAPLRPEQASYPCVRSRHRTEQASYGRGTRCAEGLASGLVSPLPCASCACSARAWLRACPRRACRGAPSPPTSGCSSPRRPRSRESTTPWQSGNLRWEMGGRPGCSSTGACPTMTETSATRMCGPWTSRGTPGRRSRGESASRRRWRKAPGRGWSSWGLMSSRTATGRSWGPSLCTVGSSARMPTPCGRFMGSSRCGSSG
mmetsp:Transcript_482/g.1353  ORF Transcript_482/g.1353 Transcript_482/m.1353 type:complete len:296 (-) Transcript_482:4121-5008(-)